MSQITTRPVQRADLHHLTQMISALAKHHGDVASLDINALQRDIFSAQPWVRVSVAIHEGKIVGYAALCPLIQLQYGARGMDIHHMFVDSDHRKQGVGRALIADAVKRAKAQDCKYLMVGTTPENNAAKQAYLACGFRNADNNPNRFRMNLTT